MRIGRFGRLIVAAATLMALSAACSSGSGSSSAVQGAAPTTAGKGSKGGEASRVGSQGRGPNSAEEGPDEIVNAVLDDVEDYWGSHLEETYGVEFKPLAKGRHPYDASTPPPSCGGTEFTYAQQKHNAYYCYLDDYIAWDRGDLIPQMNAKFGKFAVGLVLAHEWGHGISNRGGVSIDVKTIVKEQQADCFAGAWARWQADGNGKHLTVQTGDLQKGLAALLELRDPVGATDPNEPGAHGTAFDRINAFQEGFVQGPKRCAEYLKDLPQLTQAKFSDDEEASRQGNAPYDDIVTATARDLNDFYTEAARRAGINFRQIDSLKAYTSPPRCGTEQLTEDQAKNNVFYCAPENYVGYDDTFLRNVYDAIGDFGVATLMAHQFAVAAQLQNQVDAAATQAQLQQSCLTGAWAATVSPGSATQRTGPDALSLSPGDLDESIQAFLAFSEPPENEGKLDSFERVKALRTGFFEGAQACSA